MPKVTLDDIPDLEKLHFKFQNIPNFPRICTNPRQICAWTQITFGCCRPFYRLFLRKM